MAEAQMPYSENTAAALDMIVGGGPSPVTCEVTSIQAQHPDDEAVDAFASAMKAKLAEKRAEGYGGWNDPEQCGGASRLAGLLVSHLADGDPVDIANFAMMLWHYPDGGLTLANQWISGALKDPARSELTLKVDTRQIRDALREIEANVMAFAQLAAALKNQRDALACAALVLSESVKFAFDEGFVVGIEEGERRSSKEEHKPLDVWPAWVKSNAKKELGETDQMVKNVQAVLDAARKSLPVMQAHGWRDAVITYDGDDIDRAIEAQAAQECFDELSAALEAIDGKDEEVPS